MADEIKTYRDYIDLVHTDGEGWTATVWLDPETSRDFGPFDTEAELQRAIDAEV